MIENFFPYVHNDDVIPVENATGISIVTIDYERAAQREAAYIKSLIKEKTIE